MQQNHHNRAKLLHEFQFHIWPKIHRNQVSHLQIRHKNIRLAKHTLKNSIGHKIWLGVYFQARESVPKTKKFTILDEIWTKSGQQIAEIKKGQFFHIHWHYHNAFTVGLKERMPGIIAM